MIRVLTNSSISGFPLFQRYCLNHVNATLAEMGVLKGTTTEPWTEMWMGSKSGVPSKLKGLKQPYGDEGAQYLLSRKGFRVGDL